MDTPLSIPSPTPPSTTDPLTPLLQEMQTTLSLIQDTLSTLTSTTTPLTTRLTSLTQQRDTALHNLLNTFAAESSSLAAKRAAEREAVAARRRAEDEERARRRREEDEELAELERMEDEARKGRLEEERGRVVGEVEREIGRVEEEVEKVVGEGRERIRRLQERKRELNRLIEERLEMVVEGLPGEGGAGEGEGGMMVESVERSVVEGEERPEETPQESQESLERSPMEGGLAETDVEGPASPLAAPQDDEITTDVGLGRAEDLNETAPWPTHHEDEPTPNIDLNHPDAQNEPTTSEPSPTAEPTQQDLSSPIDHDDSLTPEVEAPPPFIDTNQQLVTHVSPLVSEASGPARLSISRAAPAFSGYVSEDAETQDGMVDDLGGGYFPTSVPGEVENHSALLGGGNETAVAHGVVDAECREREEELGGDEGESAADSHGVVDGEDSEICQFDSDEDEPGTPRLEQTADMEPESGVVKDTIDQLIDSVEDAVRQNDLGYKFIFPASRLDMSGQVDSSEHLVYGKPSDEGEQHKPTEEEGTDKGEDEMEEAENGPSSGIQGSLSHEASHEGAFSNAEDEPRHTLPTIAEHEHEESHQGSDGDDTESGPQRFVTPFASHASLRPHEGIHDSHGDSADVSDFLGSRHHTEVEDDAQRYILLDQHSTTVQGEDHLFDDSDRSEGHGSEAADEDDEPIPESNHAAESSGTPGSSERRSIVHVGDTEHGVPQDNARVSATPEVQPQGSYEDSPAGLHKGSPDDADLSTSLRPETRDGNASVAPSEYATPDTTASREAANAGWTPESSRTRVTFASSPPSPVHVTPRADSSQPLIASAGYYPSLRSPPHSTTRSPLTLRLAAEQTEATSPMSFVAPWEGRKSPELTLSPRPSSDLGRYSVVEDNSRTTPTSSGNSLFKRMRNIFEQPRNNHNHNNDTPPPPPPTSTTTTTNLTSPTSTPPTGWRPPSGTLLAGNAQGENPGSVSSTTRYQTLRRLSPLASPTDNSESERRALLPYHHLHLHNQQGSQNQQGWAQGQGQGRN
ncbi:hypothetical protein VTJ49DRAFT_1032 [Mycothermus thermophilus]|uniref:Uncharacterized protein n=1 Tax=Humicola insolens TaxID=85995 RepID=A0ABR3VEF2_HUMIN